MTKVQRVSRVSNFKVLITSHSTVSFIAFKEPNLEFGSIEQKLPVCQPLTFLISNNSFTIFYISGAATKQIKALPGKFLVVEVAA